MCLLCLVYYPLYGKILSKILFEICMSILMLLLWWKESSKAFIWDTLSLLQIKMHASPNTVIVYSIAFYDQMLLLLLLLRFWVSVHCHRQSKLHQNWHNPTQSLYIFFLPSPNILLHSIYFWCFFLLYIVKKLKETPKN